MSKKMDKAKRKEKNLARAAERKAANMLPPPPPGCWIAYCSHCGCETIFEPHAREQWACRYCGNP